MGKTPQNGWFIMVPNPIKMDDLGVPLLLETYIYPQVCYQILDVAYQVTFVCYLWAFTSAS